MSSPGQPGTDSTSRVCNIQSIHGCNGTGKIGGNLVMSYIGKYRRPCKNDQTTISESYLAIIIATAIPFTCIHWKSCTWLKMIPRVLKLITGNNWTRLDDIVGGDVIKRGGGYEMVAFVGFNVGDEICSVDGADVGWAPGDLFWFSVVGDT